MEWGVCFPEDCFEFCYQWLSGCSVDRTVEDVMGNGTFISTTTAEVSCSEAHLVSMAWPQCLSTLKPVEFDVSYPVEISPHKFCVDRWDEAVCEAALP